MSVNKMNESMRKSMVNLPEVELPVIPDTRFNIADFGAVGDGAADCTAAFEAAIEACSAAGGGTVAVPPGIWLTGPIRLRSRIRLHAEKGSIVRFSRIHADYPLVDSSFEGLRTFRCESPIHGVELTDVSITGEGVFDGGGEAWRPVKRMKMTDRQWRVLQESGGIVDQSGEIWWPCLEAKEGSEEVPRLLAADVTDRQAYEPYRAYLRPTLLSLRKCKRVLLEGATFQNSPSWNLHPWLCEHVTVRRIKVKNHWYAQNGDGLDVDSCKYVDISDSLFDVGDDAICLKSGKNESGRRLGVSTEYVRVRGCQVYHGHGGFVIGSEMSGGVRHVVVEDCTFVGTDVGLRFKSCRGRGGVVENIEIRNIRMTDIAGAAITFNMFYENRGGGEAVEVSAETPVFRGIHIQDTQCVGAGTAVELVGLPEMPLRDLSMERIRITARRGMVFTHSENIRLDQVSVVPEAGLPLVMENCRNIIADGQAAS